MKALLGALLLATVLGLTGCGGKSEPSPAAGAAPLSVEEWRRIQEPHVKYDPQTFERLKKGNPKLQTKKGWEAFYNSEIRRVRR